MCISNPHRKDFIAAYSPIEAAIRWCELHEHEAHILDAAWGSPAGLTRCLRYWPELERRFNKILDATAHMELPATVSDLQMPHAIIHGHMHIKIRHVELQRWILRYYPDQRPAFLFNSGPSCPYSDDLCPTLMQRIESFNLRHQNDQAQIIELQDALTQSDTQLAEARSQISHCIYPSTKCERGDLRVIAALLNLFLASDVNGTRYSLLKNQAAIISALIYHNPCVRGLSQRTLEHRFAAAHRSLNEEV